MRIPGPQASRHAEDLLPAQYHPVLLPRVLLELLDEVIVVLAVDDCPARRTGCLLDHVGNRPPEALFPSLWQERAVAADSARGPVGQ